MVFSLIWNWFVYTPLEKHQTLLSPFESISINSADKKVWWNNTLLFDRHLPTARTLGNSRAMLMLLVLKVNIAFCCPPTVLQLKLWWCVQSITSNNVCRMDSNVTLWWKRDRTMWKWKTMAVSLQGHLLKYCHLCSRHTSRVTRHLWAKLNLDWSKKYI